MKKIAVALVLVLAGTASAGTITRGTKASGGTDFQAGYTASPSEVNTDFNTIYNEFNGSVETENIQDGTIVNADVNASAGIDASKIDDHADNDATLITVASPGSTASTSKPTTLEGEIERLRYAIKRIGMGTSVTNTDWTWIDNPIHGQNLVFNGSFEPTDGDGDVDATVVPNGWTVTTSATVAYAATDVSEGPGFELQETAVASNDSICQNLDGLKASTTYLAIARVKQASGTGGCELLTSGADTEASITSTSSSYATVADVFTTDSTPTDVSLCMETNTIGDQCDWDWIGAYGMGTNPIPPSPPQAYRAISADDGTACDDSYTDCGGLAAVEVTPPGPGYLYQIHAWATLDVNADNDACKIRIYDGSATVAETASMKQAGDAVFQLTYLSTTPLAAGSTTTFQVDASEVDSAQDGCTTEKDVGLTSTVTLTAPHGIEVLLIPPG